MPERFLPRESILDLLAEGPDRIAAATADLDDTRLRAAPAPDEWSITDILAHLRSCADVWGAGIATILAEERPTIRAVSPRTWIRDTDYPTLEFRTSLAAFASQRTDLLATLERTSASDWSRSAIVTGAGKRLERTMHWYAHGLAAHEQSHVKQIVRIATLKVAPRES
jgi:hypothetical protein